MMAIYTHYHFQFSDKEIDQLVALVPAWIQGQKIDQRKLTRQVRNFAVRYGLVPALHGEYVLTTAPDTIYDLPTEVLWRLVKPIIGRHSGYTIVADPAWPHSLNLAKGDIASIGFALYRLSQAGYITFDSAGSIWRIEVLDRHA